MIPKTPKPEIVLRNGKPSAVILDIDDYEELLEQLEPKEDLKALAAARKKPMTYRAFDEFLLEHRSHVGNRYFQPGGTRLEKAIHRSF